MRNFEKRNDPLGIYIHIPFCLKKCAYCDFFSLPNASPALLERYTKALIAEIEQRARDLPRQRIPTVYFGGGTPSLLQAGQIEQILETIRKNFIVLDDAEVSLEANPATLNSSRLEGCLNAGINRLSLGVQSFCAEELQVLGRIHGCREVMETFELFHKAGCNNFNIDLIYGIPGQTIEGWIRNLQLAVESGAAHISAYLLQPGSETPMAGDMNMGKLQPLDEDVEHQMYYTALDFLQDNGFDHYEISNFGRPGFECRHNLNYWQAGQYLGIGAGAVSFIGCGRYKNRPQLENYLYGLENGYSWPVDILEHMSPLQLLADAIINGLRMCGGISLEQLGSRFGFNIENEFAAAINSGMDKKLLKLDDGLLSLTKKGYFLSNQVLCQFIT